MVESGSLQSQLALESQNYNGNRWKKFVYHYDLISGKVNEVAFNAGKADQYFHKYLYDADNRLVRAKFIDGNSFSDPAYSNVYRPGFFLGLTYNVANIFGNK